MKKSAFTMIELVFVIVVIGIITAVMLPRIDRDNVYEAAQQVLSHIKYTQHLAMIDNKFDDTDPVWFQKMWRITFRTANNCYAIFSDQDGAGVAARAESATDPLDINKALFSNAACDNSSDNNDMLLLANNYNIDTITLAGPCFAGNNYIAFDNLGRPHNDVANSVNVAQAAACTVNLASNDVNLTISVAQETGYTCIINPATNNCF